MSNRYIGARYVPKFMGSHDPTTEYENLCVVDNGAGTSYISKQIVPAGTPLTDSTYWALYGASSGAIINLQNQIDAIDDKIDNIEEIVGTPELFGATGNGLVDDTAALQTALNNCTLLICNGNYLINSAIQVPRGRKIIGSGAIIIDDSTSPFNSIILLGDNKISGITFSNKYPSMDDVTSIIYGDNIKNVTIDHCRFDSITAGYCIRFDRSQNIDIRYNDIDHYSYCGIMLVNGCQYANIEYNRVYDGRFTGTSGNRYGISISGYFTIADKPSKYIKCNYNEIEDLTSYWEGIDSHSCENCEIIGNQITGVSRGIVLTSPTSPNLAQGSSIKNITVRDNAINTRGDSGNIASGITATVGTHGRNIIENLVIDNNNINITGNTGLHASVNAGIAIRTSSDNVTISNNKIVNQAPGIAVQDTARNTLIENNDISGGLTVQDASILLNGLVDAINMVIRNNYIHNVVRSLTGITTAISQLIKWENNNDGLLGSGLTYTTYCRASLSADTSALGLPGDFIPCDAASNPVVGWFCKSAGNWIPIQ